MFGQYPYLFPMFYNGNAATLTIVELLTVIKAFSAPNGVDHGGVSIQLNGHFFAFHILQGVYLRASGCDQIRPIKCIARLGKVQVVFGEHRVNDFRVFVLPAGIESFNDSHDFRFGKDRFGLTAESDANAQKSKHVFWSDHVHKDTT